ncbi:MAG: hypothetical protein ACYDC1_11510, partial [Limisphaerales bacterium]
MNRVLVVKSLPVLILLTVLPLRAQMVTGRDIPGFREAFGLTGNAPAKGITLDQLRSSPPANILHPGDKAAFVFKLSNGSGEPLDLEGHWEVVQYGTRSRPGDVWVPDLFKIADAGRTSVKITCPAGESVELAAQPVAPELFGGYALVLDLGSR